MCEFVGSGMEEIGPGLGRRPNSGVTDPAQDAILPHLAL
jgi:hypothetical protein